MNESDMDIIGSSFWEKKRLRQESNLSILDEINEAIVKYPDMRFIQILWSLGIINRTSTGYIEDKFYEESVDTLDKLRRP